MENKDETLTLGDRIINVVIILCAIFLLSFLTFGWGRVSGGGFIAEKLVGEDNEVVEVVCKKEGCSLLVEKKDNSRSWVWVEKIKM